MNRKNPKVDGVISKAEQWRKEFEKLRVIALDCGLTEELKWGQPCYTFQKKNVVLIHGFKEFCAILFFLLQRFLTKGCRRDFDPTDKECAGGAADSLHQCGRNR